MTRLSFLQLAFSFVPFKMFGTNVPLYKQYMDMFKLLRSRKKNADAFAANLTQMNIDGVIYAHRAWHEKFKIYLKSPAIKRVPHEDIACDHKCELGLWIYGRGQHQHGKYATFHDLKLLHQKFHHTAAQIAKLHEQGQTQCAEALLNKELLGLSEKIILRLEDLKAAV